MIVLPGAGSWAQMVKSENHAALTGVATAGGASMGTLALSSNVVIGDLIIIWHRFTITKGATGGSSQIQFLQASGSGSIVFGNTGPVHEFTFPQLANDVHEFSAAAVARIIGNGSMTLGCNASSQGSNAGFTGEWSAYVIRGS